MKKTPGDIIILHMCTINYDQKMYSSWDMVQQTDRRGTDGRTKWHMEVGAPPKNAHEKLLIMLFLGFSEKKLHIIRE